MQRLIQKGTGAIGSDDLNLSELLHNVVKSARTTTVATENHLEDMKDRAKNIGETVLSVAKSVDSLSDLEQRLKAHRGEIADAARTFSEQLREIFAHLAEPVSKEGGAETGPSPEIASSVPDEGDPLRRPHEDKG